MSEHNIESCYPRLFTPPIIEDSFKDNNLDTPTIKNYLQKQQTIITKQANIIKEHENEINNLKNEISEIKHLLHGKQFMKRSISFESNDHIYITN